MGGEYSKVVFVGKGGSSGWKREAETGKGETR